MNANSDESMITVPLGLRIIALALRAAFVGVLMVLVARVSSPLNETIWTASTRPGISLELLWG